MNEMVEQVIAESSQPQLVRLLIIELERGILNEEQQGHAMTLLQNYGVDLFDLGQAVLSNK